MIYLYKDLIKMLPDENKNYNVNQAFKGNSIKLL